MQISLGLIASLELVVSQRHKTELRNATYLLVGPGRGGPERGAQGGDGLAGEGPRGERLHERVEAAAGAARRGGGGGTHCLVGVIWLGD